MNKQYFVNVVNLETGKIFSLPTLYTDRVEACICGQNYVRDRHAEDPRSELFFRVLIAKDGQVLAPYSLWENEDEDDCDCPDGQEDCFGCSNFSDCWEEEDAEEPSSESLAEILSVFNAIRPNY
jgi:hypothetical protein